jgi:hypothetical protein
VAQQIVKTLRDRYWGLYKEQGSYPKHLPCTQEEVEQCYALLFKKGWHPLVERGDTLLFKGIPMKVSHGES